MHLATLTLQLVFLTTQSACGILVLRPGIEPMLPALGVQSLNHWTTREVPHYDCF